MVTSTMNLFVLKYCLLIGGILASTALVAGPLNPQTIMSNGSADGSVSADSIYQFGSDVFYKELDKPGNEYLKSGVSGYATNLVQTDNQTGRYNDQWAQGVSAFKAGYNGCTEAYFELVGVPSMSSLQQKTAVCDKFKIANDDLKKSEDYFTSAKASSTASSAQGFEVGMVLARIGPIQQNAEDAEIGCMKAVLANQAGDTNGFGTSLRTVGTDIAEMKRIYPELGVLSNDFN
jgi:hypothetical protein